MVSLYGWAKVVPTSANQAPTAISLSNSSIMDNAADGAVVGTITVTDADSAGLNSLTVSNSKFKVVYTSGLTGSLQRSATGTLTAGVSETLTITATDTSGNQYTSGTQTITVNDHTLAALVASFDLKNYSGSTEAAGREVTLGHLIKQGDIPSGSKVELRKADGTTTVTVQQDQETEWQTDDSTAFAALSFVTPDAITAGSSQEFQIWSVNGSPNRTPSNNAAAVIAAINGSSARYAIEATFGGSNDNTGTWTMDTDDAFAGSEWNASTGWGSNPDRGWMKIKEGPIVTELYGWAKALKSGNRHHFLHAEFWVRYWHASGRYCVTGRVHNQACFAKKGTGTTAGGVQTAGRLTFDMVVKLAGSTLRTRTGTTIGFTSCADTCPDNAEWDWSANAPSLMPVHDTAYIISTNCVPDWRQNLTIPAGPTPWAYDPTTDPDLGGVSGLGWETYDYDAPSNKPGIGPLPEWSARSILKPTDRNLQVIDRVNCLITGTLPIFDINEGSGTPIVTNATSYNGMGTAYWGASRGSAPTDGSVMLSGDHDHAPWLASGVAHDIQNANPSHWPETFFWPYFRDGDDRFLKIGMAYVNRFGLNAPPFYYNVNADGSTGHGASSAYFRTFLFDDQTRAIGWAARSRANVAFALPASSPFKSYFTDLAESGLAYMNAFTSGGYAPNTAEVLGNYGAEYGLSNRHPFQKDYAAYIFALLAKRDDICGDEAYNFMENYFRKWTIGRILDSGVCVHYATLYIMRSLEDDNVNFKTTWADVYTETLTEQSLTCPVPDVGMWADEDYETGYSGLLLGSLAECANAGITGAQTAYDEILGRTTIVASDYNAAVKFSSIPR